jgi:hypothetical protein
MVLAVRAHHPTGVEQRIHFGPEEKLFTGIMSGLGIGSRSLFRTNETGVEKYRRREAQGFEYWKRVRKDARITVIEG